MMIVGSTLLAFIVVAAALLAARQVAGGRITRATAPSGPAPLDGCIRLELGGVQQSVLLRARDASRPVLLYLHGGPGDTFFPYARSQLGLLEELFVVATWAQRGCLGSYRRGMSKHTMTPEHLVEDAVELIHHLRDRFEVERVFLLGASWGSVLGAMLAARHPELLHAYIGKAQVVSHPEADAYAIRFVLDEAARRGDRRVQRRFAALRPPLGPIQVGQLGIGVARYGGYGKPGGPTPGGPLGFLVSPDYRIADLAHWLTNPLFAAVHLMRCTSELDLRTLVPRIEAPVYVFQGALDVMAPLHLVEDWLDGLDAPRGKRLFRFDETGHNPFAEDPQRARALLEQEVLGPASGE